MREVIALGSVPAPPGNPPVMLDVVTLPDVSMVVDGGVMVVPLPLLLVPVVPVSSPALLHAVKKPTEIPSAAQRRKLFI